MEFQDLGAFSAHLARLAVESKAVDAHILRTGARAIQKDAKERIGSYQDAEGPFPAWVNLAESTVDDRLRKGFTPDDPLLRTGALRKSIETHIEGNEASIGSRSDIALYQEQGTSTIPPRPFLGPAAHHLKSTFAPEAALTLVTWLSGGAWRNPKR
ncbi:MAG: phage virion morphogenesis protein [Janthinobacterium lividum]